MGLGEANFQTGLGQPLVLAEVGIVGLTVPEQRRIATIEVAVDEVLNVKEQRVVAQGDVLREQGMGLVVNDAKGSLVFYDRHTVGVGQRKIGVEGGLAHVHLIDDTQEARTAKHEFLVGLVVSNSEQAFEVLVVGFLGKNTRGVRDDTFVVISVRGGSRVTVEGTTLPETKVPENTTHGAHDVTTGVEHIALAEDEVLFHLDHVVDRVLFGHVLVDTGLIELRGGLQSRTSDLERGAEDLGVRERVDREVVDTGGDIQGTLSVGRADDENVDTDVVRGVEDNSGVHSAGSNKAKHVGDTSRGGVDSVNAANDFLLITVSVQAAHPNQVTDAEDVLGTGSRFDRVLGISREGDITSSDGGCGYQTTSNGDTSRVERDGGGDGNGGDLLFRKALFVPFVLRIVSNLFPQERD